MKNYHGTKKVDIMEWNQKREKASVIYNALGMGQVTVVTILKDKDCILAHAGATPMYSNVIMEERSALLLAVCFMCGNEEGVGSHSNSGNDRGRLVVSTSAQHHNSDNAWDLCSDWWV